MPGYSRELNLLPRNGAAEKSERFKGDHGADQIEWFQQRASAVQPSSLGFQAGSMAASCYARRSARAGSLPSPPARPPDIRQPLPALSKAFALRGAVRVRASA